MLTCTNGCKVPPLNSTYKITLSNCVKQTEECSLLIVLYSLYRCLCCTIYVCCTVALLLSFQPRVTVT